MSHDEYDAEVKRLRQTAAILKIANSSKDVLHTFGRFGFDIEVIEWPKDAILFTPWDEAW